MITQEILKKLNDDKLSPFIGNKNANKIIYEFFDYHCSHCKEEILILEDILNEDSDVKIVLKPFPIFDFSQVSARAIIAASLQNKTKEFHNYLFGVNLLPYGYQNWGQRDINNYIFEKIINIAEKLKLDIKKFEKDMISKKVDNELIKIKDIAHKLNIHGTPSFIIGNEVVIGMIDYETINKLLK